MELSEKCVGWSVAKGKRGKKRQKVDNADLSQLSDYAAEVFYQFLLKVIKESSLFLGVTKTKTLEN